MGLDNEVDVGDALNMTKNNSIEREVQGVRDQDFMYEPLLYDVDMEMLVEENDHEIENKTGSQDELQGVEQEDPALKDRGKSAAWETPGGSTSGQTLTPRANCNFNKWVEARITSEHVTTTKARIRLCSHIKKIKGGEVL